MNARSVKTVNSKVNKLADLQTLVSLTDCDILCITETWLNDRVANAEILPDSFNIFRRDRNNGKTGGGILLAVKRNITANVITCKIILIEIQPLQGSKILLV